MIRSRRSILSRRRTVLLVLAGISIVTLLLPQSWTGGLINFVQVLTPFQHAAGAAVDSVARMSGPKDGNTAGVPLLNDRERQALEHRLIAMSARVAVLEQEVETLTATRLWEVEGARIADRGRLIPARVVADDIVPWRGSRSVTAGSLQGVQRGAAVVSNHFSISHDEGAQITSGMTVLLGETLIGLVERTGTHTSRVKLLSDVSVEMKVRVGRLGSERFRFAEGHFWLVGRGDGRMELRDVDARLPERGDIERGDLVLSDPAVTGLPTALVIGAVTQITPERTRPLFCTLSVKAAQDVKTLERVYIFDPQTDAEKTSSPRP